MPIQHPNIILFDGVCNFCNTSVTRLIRWDKEKILRYASLQSELGQSILEKSEISLLEVDSIIFYSESKVYIKSTALLKIMELLGGRYMIFKIGYLMPRIVRDWGYDIFAKNRYKWFGKSSACRIPSEEEKDLIIG